MKQQTLVQRLSEGVASARRSTNFCASGSLPNINPGILVTGVGPLKLPLGPTAAKRVLAVCQQAPYGKGTETLVDTKVRKSFELAPAQFALTNPQWDEAIRATVHSLADQLGLPAGQLDPELYKLLLYRTGGFFLPHRDSEKSDRMVGSLIVALPTPFEGGTLTVRHHASTQRIDFQEAATGHAPCFAAFYADCEHEVSKVTRGFRLCLTYNLVLRVPKRGKQSAASVAETMPASELARSISGWVATKESEPLVFAFDPRGAGPLPGASRHLVSQTTHCGSSPCDGVAAFSSADTDDRHRPGATAANRLGSPRGDRLYLSVLQTIERDPGGPNHRNGACPGPRGYSFALDPEDARTPVRRDAQTGKKR